MKIAIAPGDIPGLTDALRDAGIDLAAPAEADAILWTAPGDPGALADLLEPRHRWVALPIAGIEQWLQTGLVDDTRTWTCARGVYADGVAEHAHALILAAARRLPEYARARAWSRMGAERLRGATVTVYGAGAIGRRLAELLAPSRPRLVAVTRRGEPVPGFDDTRRGDELAAAVAGSRYLVVAAALTEQTRRAVDGAVLDALGPDGVLVNVSRGEIVDTDALVERLRHGHLRAAMLDVTDPEPLPDGHPLWTLDGVLVTPHIANPNTGTPWDSHRPELLEHLVRNARAFAEGRPLEGTIDVDAGY